MEQYVISKLVVHNPEALEVLTDMPSIEEGRCVAFARLNADLKKLEEGNELMRSILSSPPEEGPAALRNIASHLGNTQKLCDRASKDLAEAQKEYKDLCIYFGEETLSTMDPEALFGQITSFARAVQAAQMIAVAKAKRRQRRNNEHH